MKSVLITGVAGFIGCHLADFFLKKNLIVFGLDNFLTGTQENIDRLQAYPHFHFIKFDISQDWHAIKNKISDKIELVFHLASPAAVNQFQKYSLETMWANSLGLKYALEFADNAKARLIFSSTSEIYGSPLTSLQKESDWGNVNTFGPRCSYDESKRFGESLIFTHNQVKKTEHGLVRIFNTYGPYMNDNDGRVLIQFVRKALRDQDLEIYGDGQQTRSFCYIDDLIQGLADYAQSKLIQPINLGNDHEVKIIELAELVIKLSGSQSKIKFLNALPDDPIQRKPDLQLARKRLNYKAKTKLIDGLQQLIQNEKIGLSLKSFLF